ncbi:unnamed protein product [Parnassius mnemosyne]|uniref:Odorant receptor n=1 Tax=Parnassius mnemosyne TaxID=213953 RepID=A0AAV1LT42_9NEOP
MWSLQYLKDVFRRRDFDFDNPHLDLDKFHPQLKIFLFFNGIFFNNAESKLRFIFPAVSSSLAVVDVVLELMFMHHGLSEKDYAVATESFCYCVIISSIPIVNLSVLANKAKIINLLGQMNDDFKYICRLDQNYRKPFFHGQLLIWQLCYIWFIFTSIVASMFLGTCIVKLIYQSLFATQNENMVRPLAFPVWLPKDDPYRSPNYEMFLVFHGIICFDLIQTFCVFIYVIFHTLLHYYYLMKLIFLDLEVLFDGLDESVSRLSPCNPQRIAVQLTLNKRMKRIVNWHTSVLRSVKLISSIYGPPLVFQVMCSSIIICLIAYQIADYLDHGKIHFLFVLLFFTACIQLWIPCYLGTLLRNQAFEIGEACWRSGWHDTPLGQLLRSDIIILILRTQQPVSIKFIGLPKLELETFSSIISTSYSYFNILRQY